MDKGQPPPYTPHANMPQPPPAGFVPPPTMGPQGKYLNLKKILKMKYFSETDKCLLPEKI